MTAAVAGRTFTPAARAPARRGHRPYRLFHPGRPVRHPGHPAAVGPSLFGRAGPDRRRGQRLDLRHGGGSLLTALFGQSLDRRAGIVASLLLLTIPTALLAIAPDLATFAALRVAQGLCMSVAFTLTLSHLGEVCSARAQAGAFAAYITGNVASNLVGRLVAASAAGLFGVGADLLPVRRAQPAGRLCSPSYR